MSFEVWCRTDKGLRRDSNQDSFLVNHDLGLYIIADGMGGHSGGEVASSLAVQSVEEVIREYRKKIQSPRDLLQKAYEISSQKIYDKANANEASLAGMGTTMVLLYRFNKSIFVCNVGDSRAYLFRKPLLWQLSEDHSLVNEQIRAGLMKEHQIKNFFGKNVITRSVGYEREVVVDITERPMTTGDMFLLCSDGLSGLVSDREIEKILNSYESAEVVDKCIEAALKNGGDDNVTVLFINTGDLK
jgi:serine/threonine protein phosphatase PrpC